MSENIDQANGEIKAEIASRIKSIRKSKCVITAQRVADHLGVSRVTYTNIENGKQHVNAITLWKLSVLFDCSVSDFFPVKPEGYALTKGEMDSIKRIDERAAEWAETLFKQD